MQMVMKLSITDRRKNDPGKNLENRQRFLRRAKVALQAAIRTRVAGTDITDMLADKHEVIISKDGLREPSLVRGSKGIHDNVLPGNKQFAEGDVLPRSHEGGGMAQNGGGEGEDAFRFFLSRDEFIDLFLEDLELPDLAKRRMMELEFEGLQRAGYSMTGNPTAIAIMRTMKKKLARQIALRGSVHREIERLKKLLDECQDEDARKALEGLLAAEKVKLGRVIKFDPIDLRYRRYERRPKPASQAVMFCLMDVSGSMSAHMKDLAKRFYTLLYIFLTRRYRHVSIVFIRHTDEAAEVDEHTFFHSTQTGATAISSAFAEMLRIIKARYDPENWNIYAAEASDGDNAPDDTPKVGKYLDQILPLIQYLAYIEVAEASAYGAFHGHSATESGMWKLLDALSKVRRPVAMRKVSHANQIFPVFRELFEKKTETRRAG